MKSRKKSATTASVKSDNRERPTASSPKLHSILLKVPSHLYADVKRIQIDWEEEGRLREDGRRFNLEDLHLFLLEIGLHTYKQNEDNEGNVVSQFSFWRGLNRNKLQKARADFRQAVANGDAYELSLMLESLLSFYEVYFAGEDEGISMLDLLKSKIKELAEEQGGWYQIGNFELVIQQKDVKYDYGQDEAWQELQQQKAELEKKIANREHYLRTLPPDQDGEDGSPRDELYEDRLIKVQVPEKTIQYEAVTALRK